MHVDLTINEALVAKLIASLTKARPETWMARSRDFKLPPNHPAARNDPVPPLTVGSKASIDFLLVGAPPIVSFSAGLITISTRFRIDFQLAPDTIPTPVWEGKVALTAAFGDLKTGKPQAVTGFPLQVVTVDLAASIEQPLKAVVEWAARYILNDTLSGSAVVPQVFHLPEGIPFQITIVKPVVAAGSLSIHGTVSPIARVLRLPLRAKGVRQRGARARRGRKAIGR